MYIYYYIQCRQIRRCTRVRDTRPTATQLVCVYDVVRYHRATIPKTAAQIITITITIGRDGRTTDPVSRTDVRVSKRTTTTTTSFNASAGGGGVEKRTGQDSKRTFQNIMVLMSHVLNGFRRGFFTNIIRANDSIELFGQYKK